jgi:leucyl-tRNA synthetase
MKPYSLNTMDKRYSPKEIEPKWQKEWEEKGIFRQYDREKKFYVLDMFPYPSGTGLHVGHPKGYIATDVVARMKQLQGYGVLHPMGWDAFGLPAEQFAIKNKVHPSVAVKRNIATYKKQMEDIGFTYDWEREIDTTDPEYYRWTQWIFLKMFEKGLAYESYEPINWCPSCQTGLANEDLEDGACERCGTPVEKKPMRQWVLRMTAYADRLLADLDRTELDWENQIKEQQRNWIGRSVGTTVRFALKIQDTRYKIQDTDFIEVFTTRVDTIFGCTYVVVAPEHPLVAEETRNKKQETKIRNLKEVEEYLEKTKKKSDLERTELNKEKTGVKLEGIEAVNPFTGESVPVYVADYVLGSYGTGAVMAVAAHDTRDMEFASKYGLAVKPVIAPIGTENQESGIRNQEVAGVGALIELKDGEYLFQQRDENTDRDPGKISPFGGGREGGETTTQCVQRELNEELGVDVDQSRITTLGIFESKNRPGQFLEMFIIRGINEKDVRVLEGSGSVALNIEDALKNSKVTDFTKEVLRRCQNKDEEAFTEDGMLVNSGDFSGLSSAEAREKMMAWIEEKGLGRKSVKYKMRDWTFSRQRYWGEPIPVVHCEKCGAVPVKESDLPVRLPEVESYEPTGTGESPLADIPEWVNTTCPSCGGSAKRETNTMPQWAGSSWYYLRFIDPKNGEAFVGKELEKEWMPVDLYVGGAEHATRHLLYARFWHKFLFDIGVVSTDEPFRRLVSVGLINASDGRKMSKRWGNVVNPDDIIEDFGADALRLYEMFMGPFTQNISWNTEGLVGMRRFLERVWRVQERITNHESRITNQKLEAAVHQSIRKVTEDIDGFKFNTAISALMILANAMEKERHVSDIMYRKFLILLSPFAPHIAEELWERLGNEQSIFLEKWPQYDPEKAVEALVTIAVSVNGKVRDTITVTRDMSEEDLRSQALSSEKVRKYLEGEEPKKVIVVPGRIVNIVI